MYPSFSFPIIMRLIPNKKRQISAKIKDSRRPIEFHKNIEGIKKTKKTNFREIFVPKLPSFCNFKSRYRLSAERTIDRIRIESTSETPTRLRNFAGE